MGEVKAVVRMGEVVVMVVQVGGSGTTALSSS